MTYGHRAAEAGHRRLNAEAAAAVGLPAVMRRGAGDRHVRIAIVDGPVQDHPLLDQAPIVSLPVPEPPGADDGARAHGTFVAGILAAPRGSAAPAISPGCTLLVRPIRTGAAASLPPAPDRLADAILDCVRARADVINLGLVLSAPADRAGRLAEALTLAARQGAIVVAAAGDERTPGGSVVSRHPWVLPVVAAGLSGAPLSTAALSASTGRRGVAAPGRVASLGPDAGLLVRTGSSFAAAVVTGVVALLRSLVPAAPAAAVRAAVAATAPRGRSTVPPVLDAAAAYTLLTSGQSRHFPLSRSFRHA
ncbi:S8 family serine peptidase [Actinoplanes sp. NPDC024001]|uniref:S8 family serine peptidase n=1 Tax=Actinoplanes sp. NPDC024001 TaxID=3154598 RepID=UPI0034091E10